MNDSIEKIKTIMTNIATGQAKIQDTNDKEKLDWFKTINIAGEKLTDQELRNAIYTGTWLTDAKRHFSKSGCPAYSIASDYMNGSPIRQDYLETAISWISEGKWQAPPEAKICCVILT